ncbi:MAG: glycosyltransferase family 39 protein [Candidatus Omnitrophica bacterium]|nr:glycosyltransferase family 39 protein [Candidatus Omnitrophota bacterium]
MRKARVFRLSAILLFLILLFVFKTPYLNLPVFSDEINYLHGVLAVYNNHLNPFVEFWSYKPPLFFVLVALLFKIFGCSLIIARAAVLFFSFLLLYFTLLLGERLYDKETAIFASMLLFFSPFLFAQSGLFYCDILVAALTLATIYFFITDNKIGYFMAGTFLVLTKEPAILVIISIAAYKLILGLLKTVKENHIQRILFKIRILILGALFILSPLLFFLIWMLINKLVFGWFLWQKNASFLTNFMTSFHTIKPAVRYIVECAFLIHFRFLITMAILSAVLISLFRSETKKKFIKKEYLLFAILLFIAVVFFSGLSGKIYWPTPRYMLFFQPLFFLVGTASIIRLIRNRMAYILAFLIIIFLFIGCWHSEGIPLNGDLNLDYLTIVKDHKEVADFLEKNFSSEVIIATWPINLNLTEPLLGYVTKPLKHITDKLALFEEEKRQGLNAVIVISEYYKYWTEEGKNIVEFKENTKPKLLTKFSSGSEEISLYLLR